jgi:Icc-related predicted phosphoesterase
MRIVYTSDLHGNEQHYARILHFAIEQGARTVVLGGDLFPNSHEPGRGLFLQRQFLRDVFAPWLHRIRAEFRSLSVYALPGNEDWASTTDLLVDLAESELFYPLHHRVWWLNGRTWLAGSSLVPITPFVAKDWDRLEGIEPEPPFPIGGGMRSMYGLLRSLTLADVRALPTITEELALFPAQSNPAGTIYVFHSPPYATALDRLADGRAVGSRAVRAFIEEYQPPLTLHGHIHESPMVSGSYAERIGRTLCVNPGQSPDRLHAVIFDTDDPCTTLVHTVLGELAMVKTNE